MATVQFLLWKNSREKYASYRELKEKRQSRQNLLDDILKHYSTLTADEITQYREMLLSGNSTLIPVFDLDKAQDLALNLRNLGAAVIVRAMDDASQCEYCGTFTVIHLDEDQGFKIYCCATCSEIKRACPQCGQGWLRHYRNAIAPIDRYSCDDCGFTWDSNWNEISRYGECQSTQELFGIDPKLVRDFW